MKTGDNIKKIAGKPDKLHRLSNVLQTLRQDGFTGYIKINFTQGSIGRVEKFEEILRKQ
jgi:hypothetical protein